MYRIAGGIFAQGAGTGGSSSIRDPANWSAHSSTFNPCPSAFRASKIGDLDGMPTTTVDTQTRGGFRRVPGVPKFLANRRTLHWALRTQVYCDLYRYSVVVNLQYHADVIFMMWKGRELMRWMTSRKDLTINLNRSPIFEMTAIFTRA